MEPKTCPCHCGEIKALRERVAALEAALADLQRAGDAATVHNHISRNVGTHLHAGAIDHLTIQ